MHDKENPSVDGNAWSSSCISKSVCRRDQGVSKQLYLDGNKGGSLCLEVKSKTLHYLSPITKCHKQSDNSFSLVFNALSIGIFRFFSVCYHYLETIYWILIGCLEFTKSTAGSLRCNTLIKTEHSIWKSMKSGLKNSAKLFVKFCLLCFCKWQVVFCATTPLGHYFCPLHLKKIDKKIATFSLFLGGIIKCYYLVLKLPVWNCKTGMYKFFTHKVKENCAVKVGPVWSISTCGVLVTVSI